jgi:AcrR family transcriptional regulator
MDNPTRSERSRHAAIQAALTIVARDGPGRLTFDAIARESGMSKGGLMHQFPTKREVLRALLDHQTEYFEQFSRDYLAALGSAAREADLLAQIATLRETVTQPHSVALAVLAALVEDPTLLSPVRKGNAAKVKRIRSEAADPDLALLRWAAANGLALTALLGLCPFSEEERARLFDRLLDERRWSAIAPVKGGPRTAPLSRRSSTSPNEREMTVDR